MQQGLRADEFSAVSLKKSHAQGHAASKGDLPLVHGAQAQVHEAREIF